MHRKSIVFIFSTLSDTIIVDVIYLTLEHKDRYEHVDLHTRRTERQVSSVYFKCMCGQVMNESNR